MGKRGSSSSYLPQNLHKLSAAPFVFLSLSVQLFFKALLSGWHVDHLAFTSIFSTALKKNVGEEKAKKQKLSSTVMGSALVGWLQEAASNSHFLPLLNSSSSLSLYYNTPLPLAIYHPPEKNKSTTSLVKKESR